MILDLLIFLFVSSVIVIIADAVYRYAILLVIRVKIKSLFDKVRYELFNLQEKGKITAKDYFFFEMLLTIESLVFSHYSLYLFLLTGWIREGDQKLTRLVDVFAVDLKNPEIVKICRERSRIWADWMRWRSPFLTLFFIYYPRILHTGFSLIHLLDEYTVAEIKDALQSAGNPTTKHYFS
jgi:hypothetical protein